MGFLDKIKKKINTEQDKPIDDEIQPEPTTVVSPKSKKKPVPKPKVKEINPDLKNYYCKLCKIIITQNKNFLHTVTCGKCSCVNHYEDSDSSIVKFKDENEKRVSLNMTNADNTISPKTVESDTTESKVKEINPDLKNYRCEHCNIIITQSKNFIHTVTCGKCGLPNHYEDSDSPIVKFKEEPKIKETVKMSINPANIILDSEYAEAKVKKKEAEVKSARKAEAVRAEEKAKAVRWAEEKAKEKAEEKAEVKAEAEEENKKNSAPNQGKYWTSVDHHFLATYYGKGASLPELAERLGRTESAIVAKIKELDLERITGRAMPPSTKQIQFIIKLGGRDKIPKTRIEASRLIDELKSQPTNDQLVELDRLGYSGYKPKTRDDARNLIMKHHPPRDDQLEELKQLDYSGKKPTNELEAFEKIQSLKPATDAQLQFLEKNNWNGQSPSNRLDASKIITRIKSGNTKNQSSYHENDDIANGDVKKCPECDGEGCEWCDDSGSFEEYESSPLHNFDLESTDDDDDIRGDSEE